MGKTKDLFMEVQITAQMDEDLYNSIPNEYRDKFTIKKIETGNFKEEYRKCETWQKLNKELIEAAKKRSAREDEIRTNLKFDK